MSQKKNQARIIGMGSYLPSRVLSNEDLEAMVDTTDEWIFSRSGMKERRIAADGEQNSSMAVEAAKKAIEQAKLDPSLIDCIIVTTMTPDQLCPSTATHVQKALDVGQIPAFDLLAACSGHLFGLSVAKAYIESGMYRNILLISSEKMSAFIDYEDRTTCVLFGDGASAAIVSSEGAGLFIDTICLGSDGQLGGLLEIPAGGASMPASEQTILERQHFVKMNGKELFRHAVRRMAGAIEECLSEAQTNVEDISWLVPHQANTRIIDATAKSLNLPHEKLYLTIHKYGNTSASSIAIALQELADTHPISSGEKIVLTAFGGGLTWGAALLTKRDEDASA